MDLIIYHNSCPDGWCAAYICKMKYPEAELLPLNHGIAEAEIQKVLDECEGKDVIMVDYSLRTRALNDRLNSLAKSFRILDHHKSAREVLEGATYAIFDMKRSGAGLAWDYLFGKDSEVPSTLTVSNPEEWRGFDRPWWVNYTEDQDLWAWKLKDSDVINAYLMVQPKDLETWNAIQRMNVDDAVRLGKGTRAYIEYYTRSVVAEAQEGILNVRGVGDTVASHRTAVLNIPYAGVSEAGNALCKSGYPVSLLWFERGDGITQFSLRGDGSVDVSAIAMLFGGGGHHNAAGFQLSLAGGRELVDRVLGRGNYALGNTTN